MHGSTNISISFTVLSKQPFVVCVVLIILTILNTVWNTHVWRNNAGFFTSFCLITSKHQALRRMGFDKKACRINSQNFVPDRSHSYNVIRSQELVRLRVHYLLPFESNWNGHTNYAAVQIGSIRFHNNSFNGSLHILCVQTDTFWWAISNVSNLPKKIRSWKSRSNPRYYVRNTSSKLRKAIRILLELTNQR